MEGSLKNKEGLWSKFRKMYWTREHIEISRLLYGTWLNFILLVFEINTLLHVSKTILSMNLKMIDWLLVTLSALLAISLQHYFCVLQEAWVPEGTKDLRQQSKSIQIGVNHNLQQHNFDLRTWVFTA